MEEGGLGECLSIKTAASVDMQAPATQALHELTHWKELTTRQGKHSIDDWNQARDAGV